MLTKSKLNSLIQSGIKTNKYKGGQSLMVQDSLVTFWADFLSVQVTTRNLTDHKETIALFSQEIKDCVPFFKEEPLNVLGNIRLDSLAYCSKAMSEDSTRYLMVGVYVNPVRNEIVATDGHRLHISTQQGLYDHAGKGVIIPAEAVKTCIKVFDKGSTLDLEKVDRAYSLVSGDTRVTFQSIEGDYPNYVQVIPALGYKGYVTYEEVLNVPAILAHKPLYAKNLSQAHIGDNLITEKVRDTDMANVTLQNLPMEDEWVKYNVKLVRGDIASNVLLNFKYLKDSLYSDENTLYIKDALSPVAIHQGKDQAVIMPMRK